MEKPIAEEGVWKVVKELPPDKAPDPDGFTNRFFRIYWSIIKVDVMRVVEAFAHGDTHGMERINCSLVTLIPKIDGAVQLQDFQPVSLTHGVARILVKSLANHVAPELPLLVRPHQSALVRGCTLHDNSC